MIYMDHAATSALTLPALEAMLPWLRENYGNPSSVYGLGRKSREAISQSRSQIAQIIGARPGEIYFTSGGTESDNWALKSAAEAFSGKGRHIITTAIEHPAVLRSCDELEERGFSITRLGVDGSGVVSPEAVERAVRPDTILISVMTANNEVGAIQPIPRIGAIAHARGILFHTDAVQALGQIPLQVDELQVDLLSASAHKLGGPKGVGLLYIRRDLALPSFVRGGAQERGRRAGTENVAGIVGFARAALEAERGRRERGRRERFLRDRLAERILEEIPGARITGPRITLRGDIGPESVFSAGERLPGHLSLGFPGVESEMLLVMLDEAGICASAGSACASGSLEPSHVLEAMGVPRDMLRGSLRLTLGGENTLREVDCVAERLKQIVGRLARL